MKVIKTDLKKSNLSKDVAKYRLKSQNKIHVDFFFFFLVGKIHVDNSNIVGTRLC